MKKIILSLLVSVSSVSALIDGTLYPSFGTGGQITKNFYTGSINQEFDSIKIQADSKIVAAGFGAPGGTTSPLIVRFNSDGTLDTSFGDGGKIPDNTPFAGHVYDVVIQPDGKIVVAGDRASDFAIARYLSNGTIDTTFGGGDGFVQVGISGVDAARALALQKDGKIVVVGYSNGSLTASMVRLLPNGDLDTTFGTNGVVGPTNFSQTSARFLRVKIQNDQKIVVAGYIDTGSNNLFVARYMSDGSLDPFFGSAGIKIVSGNRDNDFMGLEIQADGKIVISGTSATDNDNPILVRLTAQGQLDASFGNDGVVEQTITGSTFTVYNNLALQSDGKIVAVGYTQLGDLYLIVARYNVDGSLDLSFANGVGYVTKQILSSTDVRGLSNAITSDGNIVVSGVAVVSAFSNAMLAEFAVDSLHYSKLSQGLWSAYYNQNI